MEIPNNIIWNNVRKSSKIAIKRSKLKNEEPIDSMPLKSCNIKFISFNESIWKNENDNNKKTEIILNNTKKIENLENSTYFKSAVKAKKKIKLSKNKNKRATSETCLDRRRKKNLSLCNNDLNLTEFFPRKTMHKKSYPGIIGLINIGATCYMNGTLQCFSNLSRFRTQLLDKKFYQNLEKNKFKDKKLSFALAEVLKNLWEKLEQRFYAPENFKKVISEMNSLFKGIAANDPKDLILFLLETMHKEMNSPRNEVIIDKIPNNTNLNEVYNNFVNYYSNKNKSLISDEFYGFINNYTTCGCCNIKIHNVQIINILFFPLEEVKKFKNYNHNNVSILDCFEYYEKMDIYPSFHCNYCQRNCHAYSQNKILFSPQTLIINLNRGKGLEFNVNIIFEEYLNLRKFIQFKNSPYYYELTGVICHFGSNDEGGHFIAYCKNSENCEWYKYNDQIVSKCNFNEVKENGLHYTLFYNFIKT